MEKWKVGDRVRRTKDFHDNMKPGDIATISHVNGSCISLKEYNSSGKISHSQANLELIIEQDVLNSIVIW